MQATIFYKVIFPQIKLNDLYLAASMVVESARICGRVGLHGGMTSYLGRAWWVLELPGCHCMGACITGLG